MNYLWILTLLFVVAKLVGAVHWSWWLVLLPALISISLTLLILTAFAGIVGLALLVGK